VQPDSTKSDATKPDATKSDSTKDDFEKADLVLTYAPQTSVGLRRGALALLFFLTLVLLSKLRAGDPVALAPACAALLVVWVYRKLDPAGWVFEAGAAGDWRCSFADNVALHGELRSHGRFSDLLWLELRENRQAWESDPEQAQEQPRAQPRQQAQRLRGSSCTGTWWRPGLRSRATTRSTARTAIRYWLLYRDAQTDDEWRSFRRALRLNAYACESRN
jgi:hypothetical protein